MKLFSQWLEAIYDPENQTNIPDGKFYAIKMRDGRVIYYTDVDNHYEVIRRSRAAKRDIIATGWLDWGEFYAKPWGDPFQFAAEKESI